MSEQQWDSVSESFWKALRDEFLLDRNSIHMAGFWLASHPDTVRASIKRHRDELDHNPYTYVVDNEEQFDNDVRRSLGRFFGIECDTIALTTSSTEGLSIVFSGMSLSSSDEVLYSTHDHYSLSECLLSLASRSSAALRKIKLYDDAATVSGDAIVEKLLAAITLKTRLVALTWVHSSTGVRLPIQAICDGINSINSGRVEDDRIMIVIDATHGCGAVSIDVGGLGCDYFVGAVHKWMCGPRGTGFVLSPRGGLGRLSVTIPSFAKAALRKFMGVEHMGPSLSDAARLSPGGFCAFEHRWSVPAAVEFLERVGIDRIETRLSYLSSELKRRLCAYRGLSLVTPANRELSAGIVCFSVKSLSPEDVVSRLRERSVIASVSPYPVRYARLTPAIYNSISDVRLAADAVGEICLGGSSRG